MIFGIRSFDQSGNPGTASGRQEQGWWHLPGRGSLQSPAAGQGQWVALDFQMWLDHVPWAGRYWALPALTVLAPSSRYRQQQGRRHKKITDWARQMVIQLRRWLPHRPLALVGDNGYAVPDLLHCRMVDPLAYAA